ncbi:aminofutalosine synthase MqnE [Salidesulfovibrio brasiliensis]|uniref:aminofutalosine synthase MqnE n=1 Tax=Salidesulfovibrio brasiliensis TaxID=221711 RepID=UPI0006D279BF|nr:aminofutalosine synthase MqnE [Salidesulfovibrio brasiliensis]
MIFNTDFYHSLGLADVRRKVMDGERLSMDDGRALFNCPEPLAVGALANEVRRRMHGDKAFFVANRHINYTNVCVNACSFCAYQREDDEQEGAFVLTAQDALDKLAASPVAPREVHIVGGCHPKLPLSYFEEMLSAIRSQYPDTVLKCFTAVEIGHFAKLEGVSIEEALKRLQAAGLDMLPGGGAEIFAPDVREQVCPRKLNGDEWLDVHRKAHAMGMKTNCTMLFGHIESIDDRLDHLIRLRELQDEHGGFVCFIPLPFLTENSALTIDNPLTGLEKLKTIAISRLMLDNVPHIKAYWVMLGVKEAQAALKFGADDFDGTVVEEKIGHGAGASTTQGMTREEIRGMIRGCGFTPVERDSYFNAVEG